jgi:hypothetical protein
VKKKTGVENAHTKKLHIHNIFSPSLQAKRLPYTQPECTEHQYASVSCGQLFTTLQYIDDMELTKRSCIIVADRRTAHITKI